MQMSQIRKAKFFRLQNTKNFAEVDLNEKINNGGLIIQDSSFKEYSLANQNHKVGNQWLQKCAFFW